MDLYSVNTYPQNNLDMDLVEFIEKFTLSVDLPGIKTNDIKLSFNKIRNTLTISSNESPPEQVYGIVHYNKRFEGNVNQVINFNKGLIDYENIEACHDNGVLMVTIPKLKIDFSKNEHSIFISVVTK